MIMFVYTTYWIYSSAFLEDVDVNLVVIRPVRWFEQRLVKVVHCLRHVVINLFCSHGDGSVNRTCHQILRLDCVCYGALVYVEPETQLRDDASTEFDLGVVSRRPAFIKQL